jgi:hypothetical protein
MNQVRILYMILVLALAGMGTWVWKLKEKLDDSDAKVEQLAQSHRSDLAAKAKEKEEALAAQNEENQKVVQTLKDDFDRKLDALRADERKRVSTAFSQFSDILDGNKKTLEYINALESKVKAGQGIDKNEAEKLAVFATGLSYLHKQYQKPFREFRELESYLNRQANANVESPNMNYAFWKRLFNSEFREKEREFYRTEGERRGFQDASAKFDVAYAAAQKQMNAVNADFESSITKLNDFVNEKKKDAPDLSDFFNQARKTLNTHQKLLEFQPDVGKPGAEPPRP